MTEVVRHPLLQHGAYFASRRFAECKRDESYEEPWPRYHDRLPQVLLYIHIAMARNG